MKRVGVLSLALVTSACAASPATPPAASPATPASEPGGAPVDAQPQAYPIAPAPGGMAATPVQSAANEIETSQRELDVAAGDCRNACRALGSMDRAAGRVCSLTQGQPDSHRCDDAKLRVYSARDRVKATCGQCDGGPSVERSAPVPSLR